MSCVATTRHMREAVIFCLTATFLLVSLVPNHVEAVATYTPSVSGLFAWGYSGDLSDTNGWWSIGFPNCGAAVNPNQSPISVVTASIDPSSTASVIVRSVDAEPPSMINVIMNSDATKQLRADAWFNTMLLHILVNGATASNATRFVLHHVSVRIPGEYPIDGVAAAAELVFVLFPYNPSVTVSSYVSGGYTFVMPLLGSPSTAAGRIDSMMLALTESTSFGVAKMVWTMPAFSSAILYTGSLPFPPCSPGMTTIVNTASLTIAQSTLTTLQNIVPSSSGTRVPQAIGTRTYMAATVDTSSASQTTVTTTTLATTWTSYVITAPPLDVNTPAYSYGALMVGMLCVLLATAIAISVYERFTFVSTSRDTWMNLVNQQTTFGSAAQEDDDVGSEDGDEESGEEGEEYYDDGAAE